MFLRDESSLRTGRRDGGVTGRGEKRTRIEHRRKKPHISSPHAPRDHSNPWDGTSYILSKPLTNLVFFNRHKTIIVIRRKSPLSRSTVHCRGLRETRQSHPTAGKSTYTGRASAGRASHTAVQGSPLYTAWTGRSVSTGTVSIRVVQHFPRTGTASTLCTHPLLVGWPLPWLGHRPILRCCRGELTRSAPVLL